MADAPRRRRWPRRLLIAFVLLALLAFFAPWIAARAGLVQVAANKGLADFDGKATIGSATLGWFLPVELHDVHLADSQGRTLATLPRVATSKSLLGLLLDHQNLGTVTLERPVIEFVCEKNTTNLETSLKKLLSAPPTGQPKPTVTVEITDGALTIKDADAAKEWKFAGMQVTAAVSPADTAIKFTTTTDGRKLDADVRLGSTMKATVQADRFPLDSLGPLLRRYEPGLALSGALTSNIATESTNETQHTIQGQLAIADFALVSPRLGSEKLALKSVDLPCRILVDGDNVKIEKAKLTCDVGTASLAGTLATNEPLEKLLDHTGLTANAELDLAEIATQFPSLLRLQPGTTLREGRVIVSLASMASPTGTFWDGKLNATSLKGTRDGKPIAWEQPIVAAFRGRLGAKLRPDFDSLTAKSDFINVTGQGKLEAFSLAADVSLGKLAARLAEFVDLRGTTLAGTARLEANSQSDGKGGSTLTSRVILNNLAIANQEFRFAGRGDLNAKIRFDDKKIAFDGLAGSLENARFRGLGLDVDEPLVKVLPTDVAVDRATGRITIPKLQAATQTISVGAENVVIAAEGITLTAGFNAHLGNLQRTLLLPGEPINGSVTGGKIEMKTVNGANHLTARIPIANFSYGPLAKPIWSEPTLTLNLTGDYDAARDTLKLESASFERPDGLAVSASGSVTELSTRQVLDLVGQLSYDLAALEPQLRSALGKSVKAAGKDRRPFHLRGTLNDPSLLIGDASFGWQSLSAYGFDIAANSLDSKLDRGTVTVNPIEAKFVAGGSVKLQPTLHVTPGTYDLTFAKGRVIDSTTLTTAACAEAIGFALPAIAKSSKAEGTISFDLDDHRILLSDIDRSTMKGKLTLHNVTVIAGPVISEVATLFGQTQPKLVLAQDQTVAIRVEKGRVYHDNLSLTMAGYTISTSGSVGFDGTLNLVVQAPLPESAVGPLLKGVPKIKDAVVNKKITIPIGGTLAKPAVDQQAFRVAVQQFIKDVTKDAAVGKLDDFLQKLAPKKP